MQKHTVIIFVVIALIIGHMSGYLMAKSSKTNPVETQNNQVPNETTTNSGEGAPSGSIHNMPVPAGVSAAKKELATTLKIEENKIVVMTAFEKEWSDSCFGLGGPAEMCLMVITSGYEVTMQAQGKTYVYRTNTAGTAVREAK